MRKLENSGRWHIAAMQQLSRRKCHRRPFVASSFLYFCLFLPSSSVHFLTLSHSITFLETHKMSFWIANWMFSIKDRLAIKNHLNISRSAGALRLLRKIDIFTRRSVRAKYTKNAKCAKYGKKFKKLKELKKHEKKWKEFTKIKKRKKRKR